MTGFSRGPRKRSAPSGSGQGTESPRFADRPWSGPRVPARTASAEPDAKQSTERSPATQAVQRRFTIQPITPVARVGQPVIHRPVVQAKIGIGFELRNLPVDDDMPILDVTVAATRPPIDLNTKTAVLKRQGLNSLPKGNAFRHIIAYDNLVVRLENGLKGKTSNEALEWLRRSSPQGSIYQASGQLSNRLTNQVNTNRKMVEDGALLWLKRWQNHPANLFVGSASENSSLGSDYDDPTLADSGKYQQKFASGKSLPKVFEEHETVNFNPGDRNLWFGHQAAQEYQARANAEGEQIQPDEAENAILFWLVRSGENDLVGRIHSSMNLVQQSPAWKALVEIIVARTRGKARKAADVIPRYWPKFQRQILQVLPPPVVPQQIVTPTIGNATNNSVQFRLLSRSPAAPADRPRDARGADVRIALPSRPARLGPPLIIQAKEGVDVSYELKSQPIHPTAPITSVTVSGARPPIRVATKRTVLDRYSLNQQATFISAGTTLKKGWVWRHILPYATLATRLEAALEGKTLNEANQWLTDNRPLGAPAEGPVNGALSPRLQLEARALSWLDGWQNNPLNLFIGSAEENSTLKDAYDDPQAADSKGYALQHEDQNRVDTAFTYSTPDLPSPAADYSQANHLFFGAGALKDLEQQTRADSQPSLSGSEIEEQMFKLLKITPSEDAQVTAKIWTEHQDGHMKLRAATGWQALIRLYEQWSKGRPKPDEKTVEDLWVHWWPRFEGGIRQQMEKQEIGVPTGLIMLGGRKEPPKFDFRALKEKQELRQRQSSSGSTLKAPEDENRKRKQISPQSNPKAALEEQEKKKRKLEKKKEVQQQDPPKPDPSLDPEQTL